ncbi:thaumatin-like protein [Rhodamnia argentea]|uniref:Thaumatin-like protein n=1 Tax=Rhodamnia argentea TaxID=178133 RepID=A0A8B8P2L5_9MYRT|nr:thaumatin-like protein [Rhodamnia argentea]
MPSSSFYMLLLLSWLTLSCTVTLSDVAHQLILVNNCNHTIWPATLGGAGHATPRDGGFRLDSGGESVVDLPELWSGRIWARQGCAFDEHGKGACSTGGCGGGVLRCRGTSGEPPATVVEMTLGTTLSPLHFYDVSLVDGFNLPVSARPVGGSGGCGVAACEADLNVLCPGTLEVRREGRVVACKSACLAMGSAKYCCTGRFGSPTKCKPTLFANLFKAMCPKAYSYAFDDAKSLNKCRASRYVITFCPPQ